jgi:hypothetical protein
LKNIIFFDSEAPLLGRVKSAPQPKRPRLQIEASLFFHST